MTEPKFSDDDFKALVSILKRYGETGLDQWDRWKFKTKYGDVFVQITREADEYPGSWTDIINL